VVRFWKKAFLLAVLAVSLFVLSWVPFQREVEVSGPTMGTYYRVKFFTRNPFSKRQIGAAVQRRLRQIDSLLSTYKLDSEISRANRLEVGEMLGVSRDFQNVFRESTVVYKLSEGAWDGTVFPLTKLWGFNRPGGAVVPTRKEIVSGLRKIGFGSLSVDADGMFSKSRSGVLIDFSSIAKGYAVDELGRVLKAKGIHRFLIDIGGELLVSGLPKGKDAWTVGIDHPEPDLGKPFLKILKLRDRAVATSGDYRNFFIFDGKKYSHLLDPRTGYPVANGVVSVTVVAKTCVLADGLATALMVMGPIEGIALLDGLENVEGLVVVRLNGGFKEFASNNFKFLEV